MTPLTAHEFEILWSAVSKLESQVLRNPELPQYYKSVCADAFEILRQQRNMLTSEAAAQPTCIGYEGKCEGNLPGESHAPNCPLTEIDNDH